MPSDGRSLRRLLPPSGGAYELFNLSVTFYVIILCNYLIAPPSPTTRHALDWLLGETPLLMWGIGLNLAAIVGVVTSYHQSLLRIGYGAIVWATGVWSTVLFIGWVANASRGMPFLEAVEVASSAGLVVGGLALGACALVNCTTLEGLLRATVAGGAIFIIVAAILWLGEPRAFSAALLYGFFARQAVHEAREA